MAAHTKPLIVFALVAAVAVHAQTPPQRIVSLIPPITEMIFAIGGGAQVVGISNYDKVPAEVLSRPKVGGLIDPDIERILALKPDLVIVYGTQADLRRQMERARVPMYVYQHSTSGGLEAITNTIRAVGARIGRREAAEAVADRLDGEIESTRRRVAGRPRPRTLIVFGRDPETLRGMYVSAGLGFLHDMLEAAGGANVLAEVQRENLQATSELVLIRKPDVILEISGSSEGNTRRNVRAWDAMPSVPAVRTGRVYLLQGDDLVHPGPRLAQAVRRIAEVLHPEEFQKIVESRK